MKISLGFFKKGLRYCSGKIKSVVFAFYVVYTTPLDEGCLPYPHVREKKRRIGIGEYVKIAGRKGRLYSPVLGSALGV